MTDHNEIMEYGLPSYQLKIETKLSEAESELSMYKNILAYSIVFVIIVIAILGMFIKENSLLKGRIESLEKSNVELTNNLNLPK